MKYYVIVDTWKREEEMASTVMGVYTTREEAEKGFKARVKEVKAGSTGTFDTENETNDSYEAYNDGFFSEAYDYIFIQEVKM